MIGHDDAKPIIHGGGRSSAFGDPPDALQQADRLLRLHGHALSRIPGHAGFCILDRQGVIVAKPSSAALALETARTMFPTEEE